MQPPLVPAPFTPQQLQELAEARLRWKKIRRAIAVATFDAWAVAVFAGLTLMSAFFGWIAVPLGAGMAIASFIEFKGASRLRRLDPSAPRTLAFNQLFLGGLLLAYAAYMIFRTFHDPGEYSTMIKEQPELNGMLGSMDELTQAIGLVVYGTLACVAIFVQGGTAMFYRSREKFIREYVEQTPPWIIQMQQYGQF